MGIDEQKPLRMVLILSWALLGIMIALSWFVFDGRIACSLLVGGVLANLSFWLMKRDLTRLLQGELAAVKSRFFIKYYARLAVITVILFLVIRSGAVHLIGLLVGLSTVFISIAVVAIDSARKELNIKEAS
ncbi:MAG: ATP synthase subunit I [Desulfobulbaceae bacterium]|nr:ATP synthase subunit I [Desulfobulbaceae bacterium]